MRIRVTKSCSAEFAPIPEFFSQTAEASFQQPKNQSRRNQEQNEKIFCPELLQDIPAQSESLRMGAR